MSDRSSPASAESISDSNEQECESSSSASPRSGDERSCDCDSEECLSSPMSVMFLSENQRAEILLTPYARQLTGGAGSRVRDTRAC